MFMDTLKDICYFMRARRWDRKFVWLGLSWTKQGYLNCSIKLTLCGWKYFVLNKEVNKQSFMNHVGYDLFDACPESNILDRVLSLEDQSYRNSDHDYLSKPEIIKYIQSHWHEYE